MSSNFFDRQESAKKSTFWLLLMFGLATVAIVITIMLVVSIAVAATQANGQSSFSDDQTVWALPLLCGVGTLLLILGGSFFKVIALRAGGGAAVAESLGGVLIYPNTRDAIERRLLNVVEEMSIASGVPVPPVYYLREEPGINAFAAGYSPGDAVIGITRGASEQLTREELQGVLAHEFSHILNGDMRIGIRVMGILYGILLMGFVGQLIFRTIGYGGRIRSRNDKGSGNAMMVILLIGLALIALGFIGTFLGNLIKAAISRQRERLADASGVQFTRNPAGLAGALKRIGALEAGSQLQAPNAAQASHLFFAEGVWKSMAGLWSSHPPLAERIRLLDPSWDGKFPAASSNTGVISHELASAFADTPNGNFAGFAPPAAAKETEFDTRAIAAHEQSDEFITRLSSEVPVQIVDHAVDHVGNPSMQHVNYATHLRPLIPGDILSAARDPYASRAVVLCMLLHRDPAIRAKQMRSLPNLTTADVVKLTSMFAPAIDKLDARVRLPLVDLAIPALAAMSPPQYRQFIQSFRELAAADGELDLFEWVLSQIVIRNLIPHFEGSRPATVGRRSLAQLSTACSVVLSAIAFAGNPEAKAKQAFNAAAMQLPAVTLQQVSREEASLLQLRKALNALSQATAKAQGDLVDACATAISTDGHATIEEVELLRGISDLLNCPMPPLLVNQL